MVVSMEKMLKSKFRQVMFSVDAYYKKFFVFDNVGRLIEVDSEFVREGRKERVFYGFYPSGRVKVRKYYVDGVLHREGGPAVVKYYEDGRVKRKEYYTSGKLHNRVGGPAVIEYYENGNVKCEEYYDDGELHRADGPAVIKYYEDGKIKEESYYFKGKCHRTDGPAIISYNPDGSIEEEIFAENDYIKAEDFLKLIRKIK